VSVVYVIIHQIRIALRRSVNVVLTFTLDLVLRD
jgi:CHAD domain-containing protein